MVQIKPEDLNPFYKPDPNAMMVSTCHRGLKRPLTPSEQASDDKAIQDFTEHIKKITNSKRTYDKNNSSI